MIKYFTYINEETKGPFTIEEIKNIDGLTSESYLMPEGQEEWVLLKDIPELKNFANQLTVFYINKGQDQEGPYKLEQIKDQLNSGELLKEHWIWDNEINNWDTIENYFNKNNLSEEKSENEKTVTNNSPTEATGEIGETEKKEIKFPCKNHPKVESLVICSICHNDFCEDCLVEKGGKSYCKECFESNKDEIENSGNKTEKKGLFAKLFKKKK